MASLSHTTQLAASADPALMQELAGLITTELNLDVPPADIAPEAPLYGEGLGLDALGQVGIGDPAVALVGFHELDGDHQAHTAGVADRPVARLEGAQTAEELVQIVTRAARLSPPIARMSLPTRR